MAEFTFSTNWTGFRAFVHELTRHNFRLLNAMLMKKNFSVSALSEVTLDHIEKLNIGNNYFLVIPNQFSNSFIEIVPVNNIHQGKMIYLKPSGNLYWFELYVYVNNMDIDLSIIKCVFSYTKVNNYIPGEINLLKAVQTRKFNQIKLFVKGKISELW